MLVTTMVIEKDNFLIRKMWRLRQLPKIKIYPMIFGFATVEHVDTTVTSKMVYLMSKKFLRTLLWKRDDNDCNKSCKSEM
jgi:hypothetical protein